jgi:hypothetical protein
MDINLSHALRHLKSGELDVAIAWTGNHEPLTIFEPIDEMSCEWFGGTKPLEELLGALLVGNDRRTRMREHDVAQLRDRLLDVLKIQAWRFYAMDHPDTFTITMSYKKHSLFLKLRFQLPDGAAPGGVHPISEVPPPLAEDASH